jgi:hypothetical protein
MFTAVPDTRDTEPGRSYHPTMPSWRCPHCSTPQPEASRCWVCHRSSTSCGTCRNFRGSVAARVGFCGLDRRRQPLQGDEVRSCWEDGAVAAPPDPVTPGLLDLLTVARLGSHPVSDADDPGPRPAPRPTAASSGGSRRLWVEVEASAR